MSSAVALINGPALSKPVALSFFSKRKSCANLPAKCRSSHLELWKGFFKGRCYSTLAQMLGTRSVTERLAHLLLYLCEAFGVEVENGTLIGNSVTHAELANMVEAARQWVTISLKKMERRGVIACHNTTITICRPDLLAEVLNQKE